MFLRGAKAGADGAGAEFSFIGPEVVVTGNVETDGRLHVDGRIAVDEYGRGARHGQRAREAHGRRRLALARQRGGDGEDLGPLVAAQRHGGPKVAQRLGNSPSAVKKLHETISPRFAARNGGYTRIIQLGKIGKQATESARIEFVQ